MENADGLSRLPLPTIVRLLPQPYETVLLMEHLESSLVTVKQIRSWTDRDPTLVNVRKWVLQGWPGDSEDSGQYAKRKGELSIVSCGVQE